MSGIAIMAFDPGGKSGVSWGWFNSECATVGSALRRARARGSLRARELTGTPWAQAWTIAEMWREFHFYTHVELRNPLEDIHLVGEDFQLRQLNADLAPVQVTYGVCTLLAGGKSDLLMNDKNTDRILDLRTDTTSRGRSKNTGHADRPVVCIEAWPLGPVIFQEPGDAKNIATNQRLKDWDAWFIGSEHMRDSTRHLALKLSKELE